MCISWRVPLSPVKKIQYHSRCCSKYPAESIFFLSAKVRKLNTRLALAQSFLACSVDAMKRFKTIAGFGIRCDRDSDITDTIGFLRYICALLYHNLILDNCQFRWNTEWSLGLDHFLVSCLQRGAYAAHAIAAGWLAVPCVRIWGVNCSSPLCLRPSTDEQSSVFN